MGVVVDSGTLLASFFKAGARLFAGFAFPEDLVVVFLVFFIGRWEEMDRNVLLLFHSSASFFFLRIDSPSISMR